MGPTIFGAKLLRNFPGYRSALQRLINQELQFAQSMPSPLQGLASFFMAATIARIDGEPPTEPTAVLVARSSEASAYEILMDELMQMADARGGVAETLMTSFGLATTYGSLSRVTPEAYLVVTKTELTTEQYDGALMRLRGKDESLPGIVFLEGGKAISIWLTAIFESQQAYQQVAREFSTAFRVRSTYGGLIDFVFL